MSDNFLSGKAGEMHRRALENQAERRANLKPAYDFIMCGAGAAGSII